MERIYASEQRFWAESDSKTIQNAIDYAEENGFDEVIIPAWNERTGERIWNIDTCILLPSNMTILLKDCHLRLVDGVISNVFRNRNAWTPLGNTLEGEQHHIRIIGQGHALIDGGKPNGLCEQLHRDFPKEYPHMCVNLLIFLHNVRHFEVKGIQFIDSRWWATCFMFCRWGHISELDFRMYGTLENQDGVDLRIGCEYITIENITGITGDDTVALTGLPNEDGFEDQLHVEGKELHIHDVTIRNIISASHGCGIVRLLCEEGVKEYNITIDGIIDTGEAICGTSVIVGTGDTHFADPPHQMSDFRNILIRDVTTCGQRAISLCETMQDMIVENLSTYGPNEVGIWFGENFECENLILRNICIRSQEDTLDSIFWMKPNPDRRIKNLLVENVYGSKAKCVFRQELFPVKNLSYEDPSEAFHLDEPVRLCSAYGRYHYMAYGEVIQNRPKDNRYDGTLKKVRV